MPQVSAQRVGTGTGWWVTPVKLSASTRLRQLRNGDWGGEGGLSRGTLAVRGADEVGGDDRSQAELLPVSAMRTRLHVPALKSSSHPPYQSALSSQLFHKEFRDSHTCEKSALKCSQVPGNNVIPEIMYLSFNFPKNIIEKASSHGQRAL